MIEDEEPAIRSNEPEEQEEEEGRKCYWFGLGRW
jgi:hypothetical protein